MTMGYKAFDNYMSDIDVSAFVEAQVKAIKETLGNEKALIAVSGGVDSTVSAVLTYRALGDNLTCAFIDDNFMRLDEPEKVKRMLSTPPLNLPVKILNERERFMKALKGLEDAEEKRLAFRNSFYQTLSDAAKAEDCRYLVQGTIKADIEETKGGIKTQHNILEQIGIDPVEKYGYKVIEPIKSLYKYQVREVARYLGAPEVAAERQPFPGPGLSVRVVGELSEDKIQQLKSATKVVEDNFSELKPAQYFAAIMSGDMQDSPEGLENEISKIVDSSYSVSVSYLRERATGMIDGSRSYGYVATVKVSNSTGYIALDYDVLNEIRETIQGAHPDVTRVLIGVAGREGDGYVISMRSVETQDFLTADITKAPWSILQASANKIIDICEKVRTVYYDITPKPPATVEFE